VSLAVLASLLEDDAEEAGSLPETGGVYDPSAEFQ